MPREVQTKKLVIFFDSRLDAAKLAAGMERDHFRHMLRLAMLASGVECVAGDAEADLLICAAL